MRMALFGAGVSPTSSFWCIPRVSVHSKQAFWASGVHSTHILCVSPASPKDHRATRLQGHMTAVG